MAKIIAGINMTLDGNCDHTAGIPDEALHQHYTELIRSVDGILYGRITYQLMEYWRTIALNPIGTPAMDEFAVVMNATPKRVFSSTLKEIEWETASLANKTLEEEVTEIKSQKDTRYLVGSRSLISQLLDLQLVDEFQLCIHPVVAGPGLFLFEKMKKGITFRLIKTKVLASGAIILFYEPLQQIRNNELT